MRVNGSLDGIDVFPINWNDWRMCGKWPSTPLYTNKKKATWIFAYRFRSRESIVKLISQIEKILPNWNWTATKTESLAESRQIGFGVFRRRSPKWRRTIAVGCVDRLDELFVRWVFVLEKKSTWKRNRRIDRLLLFFFGSCKNGVRCNEGRHSVVVLLHLRDGRWTVPGQTICSCARKTRVPPASFRYTFISYSYLVILCHLFYFCRFQWRRLKMLNFFKRNHRRNIIF